MASGLYIGARFGAGTTVKLEKWAKENGTTH